jgi:hypothetical protein
MKGEKNRRCQILRTQKLFEEQGLVRFWDKKRPAELLDDELFERKVNG